MQSTFKRQIIILKTILAAILIPRCPMLKTIYTSGLIIEPSITQVTDLKVYTNIQLMLLTITESIKRIKSKKTYHVFIDDVVINKYISIYTGGNTDVTKINKLVHFTDSSYFTKKIEHTSNIINNNTRHSHNNFEHM